jgi:hypothetical protein
VAGTESAFVALSVLGYGSRPHAIASSPALRAPRFDTAQRCPGVGYALSSPTDNLVRSDGDQRLKQAPIQIPQRRKAALY